jgi:hypothetical protein
MHKRSLVYPFEAILAVFPGSDIPVSVVEMAGIRGTLLAALL